MAYARFLYPFARERARKKERKKEDFLYHPLRSDKRVFIGPKKGEQANTRARHRIGLRAGAQRAPLIKAQCALAGEKRATAGEL
jgi:hypothetical protein